MNTFAKILCAGLLSACAGAALASTKVDLDYQRLNQRLDQLAANPVLGQYAQAQRTLARQAVDLLPDASKKRRPYVLYIAERRVDQAKAAAELAVARLQLVKLQHEHDQILLEASRRDTAATQRALEREQLQNQLAAENAQRLQAQGQAYSQAAQQAQAEATQARKLASSQAHAAALARHEANLAESAVRLMRQQLDHLTAKRGAEGMQMTLGGIAFAVGGTALRPEAKAHLGKLVRFVQAKPNEHIRIEGYTDSSGNAAVNQTLSLQRAQSVRNALVEQGVDPSRISAVGMGETNPVASNATAAGRARNRRVVVILQDK
ncbi:MAG TPA: OmpA family protein [Rhodanobacteraceae bacterium]